MRALRRRRPALNLLDPDPAAVYLRWIWWRGLLHRGWWLVTSVYLGVDARLSGAQLVLIGVAQALTGLTCEVPAARSPWGVSWNVASGADVAWITDELDDPIRTTRVLVRSGRA